MSAAKKSGSSKSAKKPAKKTAKPAKKPAKKPTKKAAKRLSAIQLTNLSGGLRRASFESCSNTYSGTASCCGGTSWGAISPKSPAS